MLSGVCQNAQGPEHNQISLLRLSAPLSVVHQEDIGAEFCRECDGLALSRTENTSQRGEHLPRTLNV